MNNEVLLSAETILFTAALVVYFVTMILYFIFFALKKDKAGKAAGYVLALGFALHTISLVCRGIGAGRMPLSNQYEFADCFAWGIALCSLIFIWRYRFGALGTFAVPVVFVIMSYALMQNREVSGLRPSLQSNWLKFHVSTAIISYGSFGVAFAVSLIYLIREKMKDSEFARTHVPQREKLDMISYRAICLGQLFLTFVIVTGAIWAQKSWGSYWSWDPKETWSLVTWLIYALYLHLRVNKGWRYKGAAIFAVVGFICVIFTYIGVNTLMSGLHSYA